MNKNRIKVVGGIIINKNKILVAQRSIQKEHPLKWEFPGGKIKVNEIEYEGMRTNPNKIIKSIRKRLN